MMVPPSSNSLEQKPVRVQSDEADSDSDWDDDDDFVAKKINIRIKPIAQMTPGKISASLDELRATVGTWKSMNNINLMKPNSRRSVHQSTMMLNKIPPDTNSIQSSTQAINQVGGIDDLIVLPGPAPTTMMPPPPPRANQPIAPPLAPPGSIASCFEAPPFYSTNNLAPLMMMPAPLEPVAPSHQQQINPQQQQQQPPPVPPRAIQNQNQLLRTHLYDGDDS